MSESSVLVSVPSAHWGGRRPARGTESIRSAAGHVAAALHRGPSPGPHGLGHMVAPPLVLGVSRRVSTLAGGLQLLDPRSGGCRLLGRAEVPSTQCRFCLPGETVEMRGGGHSRWKEPSCCAAPPCPARPTSTSPSPYITPKP